MPLSETILLIMTLLTIAMVAAGLFRNISIPYTVLLVLIGIGLSELGQVWEPVAVFKEFSLSADMVFFIFLPALIFESGLSLDARQLLKDIAPILTLAVPALLVSTTIVGFTLSWLLDIDLTVALLFGALISATDPVAVIALFKELGAPLRLNVLVEGESLFNDATAIVVFGILLAMVVEGTQVDVLTTGSAMVEFIVVFVGGALLGSIIGLVVSEMLYRLKSPISAVLTMSMVTAYASFILGEHVLHVSGVIATVSAALMLSIYGMTRMPVNMKPILIENWEFVGLVANSLLFLLMGLSIDIQLVMSHLNAIIITIIVVLLARATTVYPLVPLTVRMFKLPEISIAERHIMWWGGLKGGLAIAIVLSIPESLVGRDLLISLTLGVVLFTLIINAWSIRPLMHKLQMDQLTPDELSELERELQHAGKLSSNLIREYHELGILSDQLKENLDSHIRSSLEKEIPEISNEQSLRRAFLLAMKAEIYSLNHLYSNGIIDQYTFLDIKNNLLIQRDNLRLDKIPTDEDMPLETESFFHKLEKWILRSTREKNWAVPFLSHYQSLRLRQRIQRQIAGIVMSNYVIDSITAEEDIPTDVSQAIIELNRKRLQKRSNSLTRLRSDYQDMFLAIEREMFTRAALISAKVGAEEEFHHGEISIKAFNKVTEIIGGVLSSNDAPTLVAADNPKQSLEQIPLFSGLGDAALAALADKVQMVTFLPGDVIIGENEKGHSLYIIKTGTAEVHKRSVPSDIHIPPLGPGQFFGEVALLGDHVRTASVIAKSTVVTYRLKRGDVSKIAEQHPEIKQRLETERDKRL